MRRLSIVFFCFALTACFTAEFASAQGTAFSYQGQLTTGGAPAAGNYDLTFTLYSTNQTGTIQGGPITNSAVTVSNGLFMTTLDFGPGVFTGSEYWLEVGVRTNGTAAFTALAPRQPLLPVPYAIFANTASNVLGSLATTQLSGTLPSAQISGTYSSVVNFSNLANHFAGAFGGDGSGLSNLNASVLAGGTVADARLSSNVALLNTNQTFAGSNLFTGFNTLTGTNNFPGVNTFTNSGNNFHGSFFGNGLVGWIPTNGTAIQAVSDTGYVLTNFQFVTVTLPAAPNVGDIVRISSPGAGGWQVKANSGQSFIGNFASFSNSLQVSMQGTTYANDYRSVAASSDGTRLYAAGNFTGILTSPDSGITWSLLGTLSGSWQSVACSANGRIIYVVSTTGAIQMSSNSGSTWSTVSGSATTIACTADGSRYFTGGIACSGNGIYQAKLVSGAINISTNSGSSWFSIPGPVAGLGCLAVSGDCTRLVAGVNNGLLYGSANVGATWTAITTTNQSLYGAWMSSDGTRFASAVGTSGSITGSINNYDVSVLPASCNNSLAGSQGSAVELQYTGGGRFMPVSSAGTLWAN